MLILDMENQSPLNPQDNNSQNPTAPQPGEAAPNPPQPQVISPQPVVSTPAPTAIPTSTDPMSSLPTTTSSKSKRIVRIIVIVILLAMVALVARYVMSANAKPKGHVVNQNQLSGSTTTSTTSDIANEKNIPFGKTASDGSFQAKLLGTTPNPVVTGDQPDPGTEYLEADFSVTSIANRNNYAFNMLYLPSIVPSGDKMGNIEFTPVDSTSPISPLTFNAMPTKNVQIAGKVSAEAANSLPSDGSVKTVEVYTLFEIKQNDKGQIVWQGVDNGVYHFETK